MSRNCRLMTVSRESMAAQLGEGRAKLKQLNDQTARNPTGKGLTPPFVRIPKESKIVCRSASEIRKTDRKGAGA